VCTSAAWVHSSLVGLLQRLCALIFVALLAGCGCTAVGCNNQLRFAIGRDLSPGTPYDAAVCLDDACAEGSLTAGADGMFGIDGKFALRVEEDTVEYALGEGDLSGPHHVTFSLRDESGEVLGEFDETVEFTKTEPNGGWPCGPTCWSAELDV
jgi:hypothetical protein